MRLESRLQKLEREARNRRTQSRNFVAPDTTLLRRGDESDEAFIQRLADDENTLKDSGMTRSEFIETCRQVLESI